MYRVVTMTPIRNVAYNACDQFFKQHFFENFVQFSFPRFPDDCTPFAYLIFRYMGFFLN